MSQTIESAPPASRLRRARAFLLALAIPCLSLVVVFATPQTAHALSGPKVIQGALKSPPAQIIRWTPAGRLITAGLGLGMLAYETREHWWPIFSGWVNPKDPTNTDGPDKTQCTGGSGRHVCAAGQLASGGLRGVSLMIQYEGTVNLYPDFKPGSSWRVDSTCVAPNGSVSGYTNNMSVGTITGASRSGTHTVVGTINLSLPEACGPNAAAEGVEIITATLTPLDTACGPCLGGLKKVFLDGLNGGLDDSTSTTETNINCRNVESGQIVGTVTKRVTGESGRLYIPSCAESYPGSIPWSGDIKTGRNGNPTKTEGTFTTDETLYNQWRDCFGPTGVVCKTEVYVDGQRCVIGRDVCVIWWRINRGEPERVECRFGPHVVGIDNCMPLKRAYGPGQTIATQTDVDVIADPAVDPDAPPAPNPTANPSPTPTASPTPTPSSPPTTGPNPETPAPSPPTPETNPDSRSCYGEAWSWNPVDWVYIPVKCALKWAFVPKTSLQTRVSTIKTNLDAKAPFSWVAGIGAVPVAVGGGGGCPDWTVHVGEFSKNVVCDSSYTAAIRAARPVLLSFMAGLALWPLIRSTAYAAFPIIKPQPGVLR